MTDDRRTDPFDIEIRASFMRHLRTLDPMVPAAPRRISQTGSEPVSGARVRPRVLWGRSPRAPRLRLATVAAVALIAAIVVPALLWRGAGTGASGSPAQSESPSGIIGSAAPSRAATGAPAETAIVLPSVQSMQPASSQAGAARILQSSVVAGFGSDDVTAAVLGPVGVTYAAAAYVIDSTSSTVYWINLATGAKLPILKAGQEMVGGVVATPRLLATGGPDVLILDASNQVWRWRPAQGDESGRGSLVKLNIPDSRNWGTGVRAIATFVTNPQLGLYDPYVVAPSVDQILKYAPAVDGSGFPSTGKTIYLRANQDLSAVYEMYVDGHVFLVDGGKVTRYSLGVADGWTLDSPPGLGQPYYTRLAADNAAQDRGTLYAFDRANGRVVAFRKVDGSFIGQYAAQGSPYPRDPGDMFVVAGGNGDAPTLYWTEAGAVMSAALSS